MRNLLNEASLTASINPRPATAFDAPLSGQVGVGGDQPNSINQSVYCNQKT